MKRGLRVMLGTFVGCLVFGGMQDGNGNNAEAYKNIMTIFGLLFCVATLYTIFKFIVFLKQKIVKQAKTSGITFGKKNALIEHIRSKIFTADISELRAEVQALASEKNMDEAAVAQAVKSAIPRVVEDALEDGIITVIEEEKINAFLSAYGFTSRDIGEEYRVQIFRALLIRDLLEGNVKPRIDISSLSYKPMKGEIPIWNYRIMTVAEVRNVSRFEGGSQGVSIRVAKGIYWRVGKMAAQRVASEEVRDLGTGTVIVTSHHLYYHVGNHAKRIRHSKIFNIARYSDAVIVHMDGASAKPLVLKTDDSWFLANILQNAQNWA